MKNFKYITILICCFMIAACTSKNENPVQNAIQAPFHSTEWLAEGSEAGVNIDRYLSAMEAFGFSGAIIVSEGDAAHEVLEQAHAQGVDCIVIASHRPGSKGFLLGSTATKVVARAQCAVHVARRPATPA